LVPPKTREFCNEIFHSIETAVNGPPYARREINNRQVAFSDELVHRSVGFGKQIVQLDLGPFRSDACETIADTARSAVVAFPETCREDQYSFFHQARRTRARTIGCHSERSE